MEPSTDGPAAAPPLAVDLDGTLLRTDLLMEGLAFGLARKPLSTLLALPLALFGRARLKQRIHQLTPDLPVELLPLHERFLAFLEGERGRGRSLHLVTAADQAAANRVAQRIGLFTSVLGSNGVDNNKGAAKRAALQRCFPKGFAYAGDSFADLKVWTAAQAGVFVGWKRGVERQLRLAGMALEATFPEPPPRPHDWLALLSARSWAVNLLLFSPLVLVQEAWTWACLQAAAGAFVLAGMTATGMRILHDLTTLQEQRRGARPQSPFARGAIPLAHGFVAAASLLLVAFAAAFWKSAGFGLVLLLFAASLLAHFKLAVPSKPLLDTLAMALNQVLRLVLGLLVLGAVAG